MVVFFFVGAPPLTIVVTFAQTYSDRNLSLKTSFRTKIN